MGRSQGPGAKVGQEHRKLTKNDGSRPSHEARRRWFGHPASKKPGFTPRRGGELGWAAGMEAAGPAFSCESSAGSQASS